MFGDELEKRLVAGIPAQRYCHIAGGSVPSTYTPIVPISNKTLPMLELACFVEQRIWFYNYPVRFFLMDISARTTIIRLDDGGLWVHSPGPLSPELVSALNALGPVRYLVAPGNFHYLHVRDFQKAYPNAVTFLCPGIDKKAPNLPFHELLGHTAPKAWRGQIDQVHVRGAKHMTEVAFCHRDTKTLILTDLIENIGSDTPDVDWKLRFWWKRIFHMWNTPKPAPEYQLGTQDRDAIRAALQQILSWDFDRIMLAHGDLILDDAKEIACQAWSQVLSDP